MYFLYSHSQKVTRLKKKKERKNKIENQNNPNHVSKPKWLDKIQETTDLTENKRKGISDNQEMTQDNVTCLQKNQVKPE
jgi:hypothetical protein